ncbi:SDR family oxidoreductase [Tenacibaculum sp. M341]|uniref:SDR family oxidoreductase n=1 Tax=Tenacibaculum sp. M341 TaxID=2530339 RepID=UPI00104BCE4E|nr:SDR family oxidoreductase [Tenacibaculum sp. M341]TCI84803.1 SDR family oxidoreductase [Tenacibaculum sp. M341]
MEILVLGATGNTGSLIVNQLKEKQVDFGIMATKNSDTTKLGLEENQIRIGDFNDIESLITVFEGVEKIYVLTPIHPKAQEWVENIVSAAKTANVKHLVKQSGFKARKDALSGPIRVHAITDELIKKSGLDYTLIQPNMFFQYFYLNLETINAEGNFYSCFGDTALSLVDINDVVDIAVKALTEDGHAGKTYCLTGPESFTSAKHAELLTEVSGKQINYVDIPKEALIGAYKQAGLGDWLAVEFGEMFEWFTVGDYTSVTDTVETVLGRKPRSFTEFSKELAHSIKK